ncbi:hypothetical protein DIPPA_19586 [Diplonema papillatum]|nr:hypothetical protein DIPPA_19586 [Diplonema papillatum]
MGRCEYYTLAIDPTITFAISVDPGLRSDAEISCTSLTYNGLTGRLARVAYREESERINPMLSASAAWIDGMESGGTWTWSDGAVFWDGSCRQVYCDWAFTQPGAGSHINLDSGGEWVSVPRTATSRILCEFPCASDADCVAAGVNEVARCGDDGRCEHYTVEPADDIIYAVSHQHTRPVPAKAQCEALTYGGRLGRLARLTTADEGARMGIMGRGMASMGLTAIIDGELSGGVWSWSDGTPFWSGGTCRQSYCDWSPSSPAGDKFVAVGLFGALWDINADRLEKVICEFPCAQHSDCASGACLAATGRCAAIEWSRDRRIDYFHVESPTASRSDALHMCGSLVPNARLARITTEAEFSRVAALQTGPGIIFDGTDPPGPDHAWVWSDGTVFWSDGACRQGYCDTLFNPSNTGSERRMTFDIGRWVDVDASVPSTSTYFCEVPCTSDADCVGQNPGLNAACSTTGRCEYVKLINVGWYHTFGIADTSDLWHNALRICSEQTYDGRTGRLARPTSAAENDDLMNLMVGNYSYIDGKGESGSLTYSNGIVLYDQGCQQVYCNFANAVNPTNNSTYVCTTYISTYTSTIYISTTYTGTAYNCTYYASTTYISTAYTSTTYISTTYTSTAFNCTTHVSTTHVSATYISTTYIGTTYISTAYICTTFISTTYIGTTYISTSSATYISTTYIGTTYISTSSATYISTTYIGTTYISTSYICTTYVSTIHINTTYISTTYKRTYIGTTYSSTANTSTTYIGTTYKSTYVGTTYIGAFNHRTLIDTTYISTTYNRTYICTTYTSTFNNCAHNHPTFTIATCYTTHSGIIYKSTDNNTAHDRANRGINHSAVSGTAHNHPTFAIATRRTHRCTSNSGIFHKRTANVTAHESANRRISRPAVSGTGYNHPTFTIATRCTHRCTSHSGIVHKSTDNVAAHESANCRISRPVVSGTGHNHPTFAIATRCTSHSGTVHKRTANVTTHESANRRISRPAVSGTAHNHPAFTIATRCTHRCTSHSGIVHKSTDNIESANRRISRPAVSGTARNHPAFAIATRCTSHSGTVHKRTANVTTHESANRRISRPAVSGTAHNHPTFAIATRCTHRCTSHSGIVHKSTDNVAAHESANCRISRPVVSGTGHNHPTFAIATRCTSHSGTVHKRTANVTTHESANRRISRPAVSGTAHNHPAFTIATRCTHRCTSHSGIVHKSTDNIESANRRISRPAVSGTARNHPAFAIATRCTSHSGTVHKRTANVTTHESANRRISRPAVSGTAHNHPAFTIATRCTHRCTSHSGIVHKSTDNIESANRRISRPAVSGTARNHPAFAIATRRTFHSAIVHKSTDNIESANRRISRPAVSGTARNHPAFAIATRRTFHSAIVHKSTDNIESANRPPTVASAAPLSAAPPTQAPVSAPPTAAPNETAAPVTGAAEPHERAELPFEVNGGSKATTAVVVLAAVGTGPPMTAGLLVLSSARCFADDRDISFVLSPTQLRLPGESGSLSGCIVGNAAVLVAAMLLHVSVSGFLGFAESRHCLEILAKVNSFLVGALISFSAWSLLIFLVLYQGFSTCGILLLLHVGGIEDVVLVAASVVSLLVAPIIGLKIIQSVVPKREAVHVIDPVPSRWNWFIGRGEWVSAKKNSVERYGSLFQQHAPQAVFFTFIFGCFLSFFFAAIYSVNVL